MCLYGVWGVIKIRCWVLKGFFKLWCHILKYLCVCSLRSSFNRFWWKYWDVFSCLFSLFVDLIKLQKLVWGLN